MLFHAHVPLTPSTDPYYYLQYVDDASASSSELLAPSFLSMDTDGRVLRVDSFSKVMMPGMRLGWITSSPQFVQPLVYLNESSTQHPHGFGQVFVTELLSAAAWGFDGFDRWTRSLRKEYQRRRDVFQFHGAYGADGRMREEISAGGPNVRRRWIGELGNCGA